MPRGVPLGHRQSTASRPIRSRPSIDLPTIIAATTAWMLLTLLRPTSAFLSTTTVATRCARHSAPVLLRPAKSTYLMAASVNVYPEGQVRSRLSSPLPHPPRPTHPPTHPPSFAIHRQNPKELFDLYEAPTPEEQAGAKVAKPKPMGKTMIRSKVHAEGHWHRYAHTMGG